VWPTNTGSAAFSAAVASGTTDLNPSDDQASASVQVVSPSAELVLGLTSAPNLVPVNASYSLVATITNLGPATAVGVSLTFILDPSVTLVSTVPAASPLIDGMLTFPNLGDLGSNGTLSATVVVQPATAGVITTYATCSSSVVEPAKAAADNSVKTFVVGPLQLQFQSSGASLAFSWPAALGTYNLQYATNIAPPVTWITVTSPPTLVNGNYTYTNAIGSGSQFFRLTSPNP